MSEIPAGRRCSEQKTKVRKRQMVWASSEDPRCVSGLCREGSRTVIGTRIIPCKGLLGSSPSLRAEFVPYPETRVLGHAWWV